MWQTSIKLKENEFTDSGYRFRYETYEKSDADYFDPWTPNKKTNFYSLQVYNHDTFDFDESNAKHDYFAELYYRLDAD